MDTRSVIILSSIKIVDKIFKKSQKSKINCFWKKNMRRYTESKSEE